MRNKAVLGGLLALVGVVAAACGGEDGATTVTFRLERPDGTAATKADAETVVAVLERRLNGAGFAGIEIAAPEPAAVTLRVPSALAARRDEILSVAERPGTLEFRMEAERELVLKWRELDQASGGITVPPEDVAWFEFKTAGAPKMLVRTPERPFALEMQRVARHLKAASQPYQDALKQQNDAAADSSKSRAEVERLRADTEVVGAKLLADSAEYRDAHAKYDEVVRDEVFTGEQLARTEIHHQVAQAVVFFEFKADRKGAFAAFTEKHVRHELAIILDGKVHSAPVIKSAIPGEGIIEGGGAAGFTESEARELVSVLSSGAMPVRLVRVEAPGKK